MPTTNNRKYLHKRTPFSNEALAVIIEEATVKSYGLDEEIARRQFISKMNDH